MRLNWRRANITSTPHHPKSAHSVVLRANLSRKRSRCGFSATEDLLLPTVHFVHAFVTVNPA